MPENEKNPIEVRIKKWTLYSRNYCIQYRLKNRRWWYWPFWKTIEHWMWEFYFPRDVWNPVLKSYESAKEFASRFEFLEDVQEFDRYQQERCIKIRKELEQRYQKQCPVHTERIY